MISQKLFFRTLLGSLALFVFLVIPWKYALLHAQVGHPTRISFIHNFEVALILIMEVGFVVSVVGLLYLFVFKKSISRAG
jgi:hypothetical protein